MDVNDFDDTKRRLIEAAGRVISEKGYHNATTREICRLAGANNAAVNYHFGDKFKMYEAVLRCAFYEGLERYPLDMDLPADALPADRLRAFIRSFFMRLLSTGRPSWFSTLMARELLDPTPALDGLVREALMPLWQTLREIIAEILGLDSTDTIVACCASSVIGQCHHYVTSRSVLPLVRPDLSLSEDDVEALAAHVACFSMAALLHYREFTDIETTEKS